VVGEAQRAVAGAGEGGVAVAVALEGLPGVVVAPAVGLDGDALIAEDEVDLERGDPGVDVWLGEVVLAAQGQEALLELALGERRAAVVVVQCFGEVARSFVAGVGSGQGSGGGVVGQPLDFRVVQRPLERSF
jgi:hypothetical protein